MKKNDYRKTLDKIKCSDELFQNMKEKLSSPIEETYEFGDTVSGTETAKPRLWRNIAAAAAACLVIAGGVGLFKYAKRLSVKEPMIDNILSQSENPNSDTTQNTAEQTAPSNNSTVAPTEAAEPALGDFLDIAVKNYDKVENVLYVEGGGQFQGGYTFTPDSNAMISILMKLKSVSWKMKSSKELNTNETDRAFIGFYSLHTSNNALSMTLEGTGDVSVSAGEGHYLYVPETESDKTNLHKILTELEELRMENVNELLQFMVRNHCTVYTVTADVEAYNKISFPTAFKGDMITGYTDVEYTLSGKIYSETFDCFDYSLMNGKAKIVDDGTSCDVSVERAFKFDENVSVVSIIREKYHDPNDIFESINMFRGPGYSRENDSSTVFTEYKDSDDYIALPGDYFGVSASVYDSISQIDPTWTEEDSDFDLREYCCVTIENNPETGGKEMVFRIDSLPLSSSINPSWQIILTVNEERLITKYEKYDGDNNLISKYELSNISYDYFDKFEFSKEMNDYIASDVSDAGVTNE